ncbi:hypothetical protein BHM03_00005220, partial [Ensete ventricosum]
MRFTKGIGKLAGNMLGERQKKTERLATRMLEVVGLAGRFTEGIGKLVGNTLGDHRKKTGRLTTRMPEAVGLAG